MGLKPEKPLTYIELLHRFLKKEGEEVSKSQLLDCLKVVCDYHFWFPEDGTLGEEV